MRLAHVPYAKTGEECMAGSVLTPIDREPEAVMSPSEGIVPAPDIPATVTTIRLASLVRDDSTRILANWSMRIATLPVFRALPELALDELQEDMPALLAAVLEAVSVSPYELDPAPMEEAEAKADAHGAKRAASVPVDVLLIEIQALQREVRNAIWRNAEEAPVAIVHELDERLNEVFELAERSAVSAWVRQRAQEGVAA
jgi:hypothetical protein